MRSRTVSPVFAGRDGELAALLDAFARVREGVPGVVIVGGEAGVGKSRLLSEFAKRLREVEPSVLVLLGGCLELSSTGLPYAPFTAALRRLARDYGPEEFAGLLPKGAAGDLARLLPELGEVPVAADPDTARARLFEQLLALLERLAGERPVLLVVEDAHWADRSTRDLLSFLTRNLHRTSILLVVTYRSDDLHRTHPLRPLLAELARVEIVTRWELPRLSRGEVAEQLAGILGHAAGPGLLELVHARSDGIPLFVEAMLDVDGTPVQDLPESLRDLLLVSLHRLPEETQRVLRVATVAGDRVGHALLSEVTGFDEEALSEVIRNAVTGNVLIPDEDGYVFRHALIREAVRHELLPGERTALHRRYAEALTRLPALSTGHRLMAELAVHWARAHDNERALFAAWDAAADLSAALAYGEQLQMLEMVLELWESVPGAEERIGHDHTSVLELASETAHACGEADRGLRFISAALDELDEDADPERRASALMARARLRNLRGSAGELDDLVAAERLVPREGPVRASVLAVLGAELLLTGHREIGRSMIEEAAVLARRFGDETVESDALNTMAFLKSIDGDHLDAEHAIEGSRTMAERARSAHRILRSFNNLSAELMFQARHAEAVETAVEGLALAHRLGRTRTAGVYIAVNLAEAQFHLGRWDDVVATVDQGMTFDPNPPDRGQLLLLRADVALARGEFELVAEILEEIRTLLTTSRLGHFGSAALARLTIDRRAAHRDLAGALAATHDALAEFVPTANPWYLWPILLSGMRACSTPPEMSERVQDVRDALLAAARDLPASGRFHLARQTAFAAEAADQHDLAARDAAVAAWEEAGEPHPLADALVRAAEAHVSAGDRDGATERLRRAAGLATGLRARPLSEAIERLAQRARISLEDGASPPERSNRFGLTPREYEVLRLLAAGKSNRELAEELFISVKTASVHVSNILAKLGVPTRGEAAATAHRLHLFT